MSPHSGYCPRYCTQLSRMRAVVAALVGISGVLAQTPEIGNQEAIAGPTDQSTEAYLKWWDSRTSWRDETVPGLNLSAYDNPELQWARTSFIQPQLMIHDKFLYDRESVAWTVDKYLDDVNTRYGGIDRLRKPSATRQPPLPSAPVHHPRTTLTRRPFSSQRAPLAHLSKHRRRRPEPVRHALLLPGRH